MAPLSVTPHYSEYLAEGEDTLWVVLTVVASSELQRTVDRAEVIILDASGSMGASRKLESAKRAASAAIDALDEGVEFAVIIGNDEARKIWPPAPRSLAVAGGGERAEAHRAIATAREAGPTHMGKWLDLARQLFESSAAGLRHAILLSDGLNTAGAAHLQAATEACRGVFQCDCRGFGTDWSVAELRYIAETLGGTVGLVARLDRTGREELAEHFLALIRDSQARVAPAVRVRVVTRDASDVVDFLQSTPTKVEMGDRGQPVESGPRAIEFAVGGWAPEDTRDYLVGIKVRPNQVGGIGARRPVAKVELVLADETVAAECLVEAEWTDDEELSTIIEPRVAFHREQKEVADSIQAGLAAKAAREWEKAAELLWQARLQALEVGNHSLVRRLDRLVYLDETGTLRLHESSIAEDMEADIDSTTTMRYDVSASDEDDEDDEPQDPGA